MRHTASIFTFLYLHELREELHGRLTLSAVSDEETFGPWGARYLSENHPEVIGDCCLNGEPSSPWTLRFGEKGPLWLEFTVRTRGAHGAYTHLSESATAVAAKIIGELERLQDIPAPEASNLAAALDQAADVIEKAHGAGASKIMRRITVNPGRRARWAQGQHGRVAVHFRNGYPSAEWARRTTDPRPRSTRSWRAIRRRPIAKSITIHRAGVRPTVRWQQLVRANAQAISGIDPTPVISLGGTDARLWRYKDLPAIVYGPSPNRHGQH